MVPFIKLSHGRTSILESAHKTPSELPKMTGLLEDELREKIHLAELGCELTKWGSTGFPQRPSQLFLTRLRREAVLGWDCKRRSASQ